MHLRARSIAPSRRPLPQKTTFDAG